MEAVPHYVSEFERLERGLPLREPRRDALARFSRRGFPGLRDEAWRYTNLAPLAALPFRSPAPGSNGLTTTQLDHLLLGGLGGPRLVFVNGRYAPALSTPALGLGSLAAAPADKVGPHLGLEEGLKDHPFAALNAALWQDGAFVHLPEGSTAAAPIHLVFVSSPEGEPAASHPRTLILAGEGSKAVVVETYLPLGPGRGPSFTNALTQVVAGQGSSLEHVKLQFEAEDAFHLAALQVRQEAGSAFTSHALLFGAALARNEIHVRLGGEGASCILNGLTMAAGAQHIDTPTVIRHASPRCRSEESYKAILHDRARGVFFGRIRVEPGAQKTEARQSNRNLLLSPDAEIDTRPQLEIYANDVSCTHGAAIGRLDEAAIFYLRSRGVEPAAARSMLTFAFSEDLLQRLPVPALHDQLTARACAWLTRHLGHGVSR